MKEIHLICNAHLDPIWQWEWEEGAAAALATFRSAADLADEFDYIFCHNEVLLYKYIEEYAPSLFTRIKELIRIGKWHVMGGWYLQPDCNMPLGESIVRQVLTGKQYFMEKFGQWPTTAINFDSFGHSKGLVQIMTKCGQDSYILQRTGDDPVPPEPYFWKGFDDSMVKVNGPYVGYGTPLGGAAKAIRSLAENVEDDVICACWGVGNHGGGPSRKDLADIEEMMAEGTMEIIHSTPEAFFAKIDPKVIHDRSLRTVMPGCYTSMNQIKADHAELENSLYMVEKICSMASMRGLMEYPLKELDEVVEDLLLIEFHDVLPGTSVKAAEENALCILKHGKQILSKLRAKAFFALAAQEPKAKDGEYPILVLNPHPYEWETEVSCEMMLADQNWADDTMHYLRVFDSDGNEIQSQTIKEESNINLDWRKRVIFRAKLKPLSLTRFSVYVTLAEKKEKSYETGSDIILDLPEIGKHVEIDGNTGLLRSYMIDGKEYIDQNRKGAFCPVFYQDTPDPWEMNDFKRNTVGKDPVEFCLMETPDGPFKGMKPIQVIEDGDIYLGVESFFICENTRVRVEYDIYKKDPAIDIKVDVFMNDSDRMVKLAVPVSNKGTYIGQTMFGIDELYMNGRECVAQRFVAMREQDAEKHLVLFNRGTYGSSCQDGVISMSLVRGATYCAHPIEPRPIIPTDRYTKKIDMGERNFSFRLSVAPEKSLERLAAEFNMLPYSCNVFPIESNISAPEFSLTIDDRDVVLVTMKKSVEYTGYIIRLLNNHQESCSVTVNCCGAKLLLNFGKYEVKTLLYHENMLKELEGLAI